MPRTVCATETIRSSLDHERKYLDIDSDGMVVTKPAAMLPKIG